MYIIFSTLWVSGSNWIYLEVSGVHELSYVHSFSTLCVLLQVIPFSRGSAWEQPPPDLASYLYKNRIVYLGMSLVPSVTELILAEFLYLQYEDEEKPIYLYVNSTGTTKVRACFLVYLSIPKDSNFRFCISIFIIAITN